ADRAGGGRGPVAGAGAGGAARARSARRCAVPGLGDRAAGRRHGRGGARGAAAPGAGDRDQRAPGLDPDAAAGGERRRRGRRAGAAEEGDVAAAVADVNQRPAAVRGLLVRLSDEQQRAVKSALAAPLTVITGGPGTGKTSIVVAVLRTLVRAGVPAERIALAA